ncbi:TAXI family TRAP transporter solute-binding subunit [Psychromarinibacter halotolerans]|uniref:TAXI family TRAP transporter solute-binding subunit n=1 Tax=Psychromarinibacter halotolerans TaxID=1775175 RepID=A0ABV7GUF6_9RHOB|nr:TAXI family TRAP transporter solute-binding subunit [Psychromarinibacter halotolerans]MDF0595332.1 TAXI family TRAP transporter solute-binding subunit [Psychromarinibacter halotolerans]
MKAFLKGIAATAAIAAVTGFAGGDAAAQGRVTIGTNPQGSLYYTIGSGIAAVLQEEMQRPVTVQPFTGSSVYLPLISAGEVTVGLNSAIDAGGWYTGETSGEALSDLRVLARLWPLRQAYITRADDGITEVGELAGKRVVIDMTALTGVSTVNRATLLAAGLTPEDVDAIEVSGLKAGLDALVEGTVDATAAAIGIPLTQQANATIPGGIRYLSLTGENATTEFFDAELPGVYPLEVGPNPAMPEITEPVVVSAYDIFLTTSASLSDEEATNILTALYDAFPQLREDYPPLRGGSQDGLGFSSNTVPYHPAAIAFFKDKGLWSDENEAREATFAE